MKIGEKIAELRREKGVTQAELADQLHFTRQAVSNWERGVTEPDAHTLPVLAAYFGITTDELLGAAPVRNAPPAPEKTAPLKKHRVEVRETARAAKALHSLLWTYAGLTAVQFLLSFSRNIFVALIGEATSVLATSANLAVFILFLCAKQPSERRRVRAAFYICWATCEVCSFVYLFTEGTAALIFGIAFLLLTPAECVLLPLAFQTEDKAALRRYFIVLCIYIALALPAALTALLSPEFAYYLTMLADVANIASLFLLDRALCDRTVESYYYTAQTSVFSEGRAAAPQRQVSDEQLALAQAMREQIAASNAAHSREVREQAAAPAKPSPAAPSTHAAPAAKSALHEITADVPAYPRALLPAAFFIGIGLFLLFILFAPPGSSVAIFVMLVLLFSVVPAVFGVLFFLVKAGRKKVPHALAGALWTALMLFSAGMFIRKFLTGNEPLPPATNIILHGGCFVLFAVLLFALPPDENRSRAGHRFMQIVLFAAAAGLTALCLWLPLRGWFPEDGVIAAFVSNYGFMLLLLLLHLIKADRTVRTTVLYGGANSSKAGTASPKQ